MDKYQDKYIFMGENSGSNFSALRQWAHYFSVEQDLPRLAATRIENRMIASASLYPDDEFGDFFEALVKSAADENYPGARKEESFWIKRLMGEAEPDQAENTPGGERYDFFVLISADKQDIQNRIRGIMEAAKTSRPPTRDQAAAINRLKQNFFWGF
jgi:hypothetical protein